MPSDPFAFTPLHVLGAAHYAWRIIRGADGLMRVERRALPEGMWRVQSADEVRGEIAHGTEAGAWLRRVRDAGLVDL
jgi:hypothetical protein